MNQVFGNIVLTSSLLLIVAISYNVIFTTIKFFHIAHAAVITLGSYAVFFFSNKLSVPFWLSVFLAITVSVGVGLLCEILVYRQMRKRKVPTLTYLIASIGLNVVLQNCMSLLFGDDTKIINTAKVTVGHQVLGIFITSVQIATIFVAITSIIVINLFFQFTVIGKSIRAVASNPELCNIYGISSNKIILFAFGIGSILAAIAGILSAMDTNMTPMLGFNLLLYGVVATIIGGAGSTKGLIAASLMVASTQHLAAYFIDSKWMDAAAYIILILFLIWKPLGFSGKRLKKVEV